MPLFLEYKIVELVAVPKLKLKSLPMLMPPLLLTLNGAFAIVAMSLLKKLDANTGLPAIFNESAELAVPQIFVGLVVLVTSTVLRLIPCPIVGNPVSVALGVNASLLTIAIKLLLANMPNTVCDMFSVSTISIISGPVLSPAVYWGPTNIQALPE